MASDAFAVQLAARAGAHVVASVGSAERGEGLDALGAAEVVVGLDGIAEPGVRRARQRRRAARWPTSTRCWSPAAACRASGWPRCEPTTIDFEQARLRGGGTRIEAFTVGPGFGPDLASLIELVAAGRLDPQVDWRGPWDKIGDAAAALLGRQVRGKAVLEVSP